MCEAKGSTYLSCKFSLLSIINRGLGVSDCVFYLICDVASRCEKKNV